MLSFSFQKFPLNNAPSLVGNFAMQPLRFSAETPSISNNHKIIQNQKQNKNKKFPEGMSFGGSVNLRRFWLRRFGGRHGRSR